MRVGLIYRDAMREGGYPRDIRWLASALAAYGVSVTLFSKVGKDRWIIEGLTSSVHIEPLQWLDRSEVDLYHFFGIFIPSQLWTLRKVLGKRVVVSPMGHLMPYHLRRKALKKKLYLKTIRPLLRKIRWFHAFSREEESSIRQYLGNDVLTFEAGLGVFPVPIVAAETERMERQENSGLNLLFFGRNDVYQKGIDILLEGFARAVRNGTNARLTIAGRPWMDSDQYIRSFTQKSGLEDRVQLLGPVNEEMKYCLIAAADYLVFLSRWDGPPRPIREAIAVGTPVIVSPETNMGSLVEEYEAGLQVRLNPEEVAAAISRVAGNRELWKCHRDGVIRVRERLDWGRVAEDYIQGYEQVLG